MKDLSLFERFEREATLCGFVRISIEFVLGWVKGMGGGAGFIGGIAYYIKELLNGSTISTVPRGSPIYMPRLTSFSNPPPSDYW